MREVRCEVETRITDAEMVASDRGTDDEHLQHA